MLILLMFWIQVLYVLSPSLLKCEVCAAPFETRRGLSSHARSHLRQLGISVSESSGAPIDLLYQLIKERDARKEVPGARVGTKVAALENKPAAPLSPLSTASKAPPSTSRSSSPSVFVKSRSASPSLKKAPISSLLPTSSPRHTMESKLGSGKTPSASVASAVSAKPFWAPQETDAPLNLSAEVDAGKEIVCQLCGAWFETRKGLSSHARAHLRHFGVVDAETKGSPIDLLNQLIHTDDFKHRANTLLPELSEGGSIRASLPPPSSAEKAALQAFRLSSGELAPLTHGELHFVICLSSPTSGEPLKEIACEFCGEYFENRKGLSSHARSHLRQLGVTEWSVNGSPIDTLRELITRRGLPCAMPIRPLKSPPSSPGAPRSPPVSPSSPALIKRNFFVFCCNLNSVSSFFFSTIPSLPAPAAEPEPARDIRCEFCGEYFENRKGLSSHARSHLRQLGITEWSVNGSPIDTLRELMLKNGTTPAGQVKKEPGLSGGGSPLSMVHTGSRLLKQGMGRVSLHAPPLNGKGVGFVGVSPLGKRALPEEGHHLEKPSPKTFSPPPLDFSFKGKSSPDKYAASHSAPTTDASCELCGFYFENRKALASHARAHLRQFGVTEWCVNGSPIETLSAWMRSRPQKVAEIHKRYLQGDRPFPKKVKIADDPCVLFAEEARGGWVSSRPGHGGTPSPQALHGLSRQTLPHAQVARSELNVRFERRPPKHLSHSESGERDRTPPQPPRTGTIPALVPKPPSTPLVKLVGKIYSLKCRFCEVEFHGPLSVQEDWVRHLQQHILDLNFNKADPPSTPVIAPQVQAATFKTPSPLYL
uniref:WIZ zinc finger n=1 Tax=Scleropages formosus TaxID=113540 RepID=A0A8C9RHN3_SCLFO